MRDALVARDIKISPPKVKDKRRRYGCGTALAA
jgi:hypothetical protein